ncbi:hypothetical protein U9M48_004585 [Paspalum notatum var. saurae]|uniref:Ribosomal protein L6 n=1 Tax=Paspalum notatum var. saurae TaxID=547442 RepID=A0AAQ3PMZ3_PASNO
MDSGFGLPASDSAACPSISARGSPADAPRPDPASPRGHRPPVPRRVLRGGALIRCGQIWHRRLCLRRLSTGKRAREARGRGRSADPRSGLDGFPSAASCRPSVSGRKRARRAPGADAPVDWCLLPEELLVAVMAELEVTDLVRAGAACSSWRAAFTAFRRLRVASTKQPPCLLYSDRDDPDVAVLRAPSSSSKAPPIRAAFPGLPLSRRTIVGSAYGWLVTADEASNLHVVNPLTGAQVALPTLAALHNVETSSAGAGGSLRYRVFMNRDTDREPTTILAAVNARETMYCRAILSCSPSAGAACVVLLLHWPDGELSFARLGDGLWTPVSAAGHGPLQRSGYRDALYDSDRGLFYVLHLDGTIYTLGLNRESLSASRIMPSAMAICDPGSRNLMTMYLVRTPSGDLLQVCRRIAIEPYPLYRPPYYDDDDYTVYYEIETVDVQVYMVDLHEQKLEKITTLGDHSLFLGYSNSICISTKGLSMLEPNLTYLTDSCYQCVYTETESSRDMGFFKIREANNVTRFGPVLPPSGAVAGAHAFPTGQPAHLGGDVAVPSRVTATLHCPSSIRARRAEVVGVGFKARSESQGRELFLKLGYSHEVQFTTPPTVRVFCFKPNIICCTGIDKDKVHHFAGAVRSCKPPDPYKGKGIMYIDEVVNRKGGPRKR